MKYKANNPELRSWIGYAEHSDFPIQNIPFGIGAFGPDDVVCTRIGESVINLAALHDMGVLEVDGVNGKQLRQSSLNEFIALGKSITNQVRDRISELFEESDSWGIKDRGSMFLKDAADVAMKMPVDVGDYTDFYSSKEHATNVGTMFRDPNNALLPNWLHLPVAYHGRASSIVVSGTDIKRPKGQTRPADDAPPVFGPTKLMDFELEMAFVVGRGNELGEPIAVENASEHIFGMVLFNDWSARDIQKWEYVPLGPFLAKNFASTVSPWVVTMEALEPFRSPCPDREVPVLDYLKSEGNNNYNIDLEVDIVTKNGDAQTVCRSNYQYMYWNMFQQLAHHTVNGCNMSVGDLCASGTISGKTEESYGSMLEITWRGSKPVQMPDGTERKFIQNGDTVSMRGFAQGDNYRIGFGPCVGKVIE